MKKHGQTRVEEWRPQGRPFTTIGMERCLRNTETVVWLCLECDMPLLTLTLDDARAHALMSEQQRELRRIYKDTDERTEPFDPASLAGGVLLGWQEEGELLAIGGLKPLGDGSAEIKRMFTLPRARGRKLGRAVLDGLIIWAWESGLSRLILETGDLQKEALRLYESAGCTRIPNFGYYAEIENSLCYELLLSGDGMNGDAV